MRIDWNRWRLMYHMTAHADQALFYDRVYELHPNQARFSVRGLDALLEHIGMDGLTVVELGGWDGGFAAEILPVHPEIASWDNYEISQRAVEGSVCDDGRYRAHALSRPFWEARRPCDLFVTSHTIEHLTWKDLGAVFASLDARWLYLQAPLNDSATDWTDYHGSHILEVGWSDIVDHLDGLGYTLVDELTRPGVRCLCR